MGTRERREREKEALRQDILDAARELFVSEGYENVSMRKIAEKIEYSPTTIYLYFKDKGDLLYHICEETFAKLVATQEKIVRKYDDPVVALKEGCRAYVNFGLKHPDQYRLTFMMSLWETPEMDGHPYEGSMGQKAFGFLVQGVTRCVQQKKFRKVDIEATSQAIWMAIHGATSLLITDQEFPWVERHKLIGHLIDTLIIGLKA